MNNMTYKPPSYCPDAIATDTGWVNPNTGELLVAIRHLDSKIREYQSLNTDQSKQIDASSEDIVVVNNTEVIDSTPKNHSLSIDDNVEIAEQFPTKRGRGRPKTIRN